MEKMHTLAYRGIDDVLIVNKPHEPVNILSFLSRANEELKDGDPYHAKWDELPNILSVLVFASPAIFDKAYTLGRVIKQFISSKITI
jgi:hypothetical protein